MVGLIDLGAPEWVIGAVAIGVLIIGGGLLNRYKRGLPAGVTAGESRPFSPSE